MNNHKEDKDNFWDVLSEVPTSDRIRRRLAVVATESRLLYALLKISVRIEKERNRLREQEIHP